MHTVIDSPAALQRFMEEHPIVLVYFTGADCGVCKVVEPKLHSLLSADFPHLPCARIDAQTLREIAAQHSVFSVPTVLVFIEGREAFRWARNFSLGQIRDALRRPYRLAFD